MFRAWSGQLHLVSLFLCATVFLILCVFIQFYIIFCGFPSVQLLFTICLPQNSFELTQFHHSKRSYFSFLCVSLCILGYKVPIHSRFHFVLKQLGQYLAFRLQGTLEGKQRNIAAHTHTRTHTHTHTGMNKNCA